MSSSGSARSARSVRARGAMILPTRFDHSLLRVLQAAPKDAIRQASHCEPVKPRDIAAGDLEPVFRARVLEVALDDLLRVRPGRRLMRVVARPHHAVDAD